MKTFLPRKLCNSFDVAPSKIVADILIGPDQSIFILTAIPLLDRDWSKGRWRRCFSSAEDYRDTRVEGDTGSFSVINPCGEIKLQFSMPLKSRYFVQPLSDDNWLVVGLSPEEDGRFVDELRCDEPNAFIMRPNGSIIRSFSIGGGVEDIQTTTDGRIWVTYRDQNVLGTRDFFGKGFTCFDVSGNPIISNRSQRTKHQLIPTIERNTLNVLSDDEVWIYHYAQTSSNIEYTQASINVEQISSSLTDIKQTRSSLTKLLLAAEDRCWLNLPVAADVFAVKGNTALCASGAYKNRFERQGRLQKINLETLQLEEIVLVDESGSELSVRIIKGRGSTIYTVDKDGNLFHIDIDDV